MQKRDHRRRPGSRGGAIRPGGRFAKIYRVVRAIPEGVVATYGEVALLAGMPGAARTVGWALRALGETGTARPVPWHRVVGAGGVISLGDTPAGHEQRARLEHEGVLFRKERVDIARCGLRAQHARRRSGRFDHGRKRGR